MDKPFAICQQKNNNNNGLKGTDKINTYDDKDKEIELLKNEIISLKEEIKLLKENCIYKIKIVDLLPNDLFVTKKNESKITNDYILIGKDGWQYGPYRFYEQGKYLIIYHGEGLLNGEFDTIAGELKFPITIISKTQLKVVYEVNISSEINSGIEFRFHHTGQTFAFIKKIEIYKYNI